MTLDPERSTKLTMELRRGLLVLAALLALREPHYGYSLRKLLAAAGLEVDEGTLYPLLRRLESQGLLQSHWQEFEGRKRRLYQVSEDGMEALAAMQEEWQALNGAMISLAEGANDELV